MNLPARTAPLLPASLTCDALPYERGKRALVLDALSTHRFDIAWAWGCGNAPLVADLAERSTRLHASDLSRRALRQAALQIRDDAHVQLECATPPRTWPAGRFDLILMDEVGFHLDDRDFVLALARLRESLASGGLLVACHWDGPFDGARRTGDQVHAALRTVFGPASLSGGRHELQMDCWRVH
jgi:hypothetical protein